VVKIVFPVRWWYWSFVCDFDEAGLQMANAHWQ